MAGLFSVFRRRLRSPGTTLPENHEQPSDRARAADGAQWDLSPSENPTADKQLPRKTVGQQQDSTIAPDSETVSLERVFPNSGFELLDSSTKLEEETFSWYSTKKFYPADIGEVLQGSYQIIMKLGYGTASTAWLCRDLKYWSCPNRFEIFPDSA
jgi:hypothetical protein